ncbi:MAG: epoxyqueuosine reductase [Chloroflexi bacterium]|nr:epoxyqueuosine reductase [Chloroflexota bacterium]
MATKTVTAEIVSEFVKSLVKESEKNQLHLVDHSPIFDEPLVGFASGDDPLFSQYKTIIGDFHMTPREVMEKATGKNPEKLSIVSWILPISLCTKASMRRESKYPTIRWSHSRFYGEQFNEHLRAQVVDFLQARGHMAVAPFISPFFKRLTLSNDHTSNWSERHAAYAAGLGTFSLSDGFITPKGIAMRCGSVVTDLDLPASTRPYTSHTANCAFLVNGSCGKCIDRCPGGAITEKGHDKKKCFDYMHTELSPLLERYGVRIAGCGFCQTKVPCESAIPTGLLKRRTSPKGATAA